MNAESDRLSGPTRSRAAIKELEAFLKKYCKEPQLVDRILRTFQYETGHEPRKTLQYMESIESVGKIRLFKNSGELYVQWIGAREPAESKEELPEESLVEHAIRKDVEKAKQKIKEIAESKKLREKMKAGPCKHIECPFDADDCRNCGAYVNLNDKGWLR